MTQKRGVWLESLSRGHITYVRVFGTVDETLDPAELNRAATGRDVILNLKGIKRISSFGVREWVHTMEALTKKVDRIVLVECSPVVVSQLNMVANFTAGATVVSVQAPFFCEACSWDTEQTVPVSDSGGDIDTLIPEVACKRCGASMQLDDDPNNFFAFTKGLGTPALNPELTEFIRDFSGAIDTPAATSQPLRGKVEAAGSSISRTMRGLPRRTRALGTTLLDTLRTAWQSRPRKKRPLVIMAGVGGAVGLLILLVVMARPTGIEPEQLGNFHDHLENERFAEAELLVTKLFNDGTVTPELQRHLTAQIDHGRQRAAAIHRDQILEQFEAKQYEQVIAASERAIQVGPLDADTAFVVAESYRKLQMLTNAKPHYTRFAEEMFEANPRDKRLDDALFWQAEILAKAGQRDEARKLYQRVAYKMQRNNFRRSAIARLKALRAKSK